MTSDVNTPIKMIEFQIPSKGKGSLHCIEWIPQKPVVAVFQIVHGIAEHILRYDDFARFLCSKGIAVVAEDHMGHGGSLGAGDPKGYFFGGWVTAVDDTYSLLQKTRQKYPNIPYIIFGHSMGSFLTRTLLYRHPDSGISGAIICGTAWQPKPALYAGAALSHMICKCCGDTHVSPLLHGIMFGSSLKKIKDPKTPFDWICSDPKVVSDYAEDPLCGFTETCGLARDLIAGIRMNQKPENLRKMDTQLPVLFVAGSLDPVGNYGKGVIKTADAFVKSGLKQVETILYTRSRHEILNDVEKIRVYQDIYQWFFSKMF